MKISETKLYQDPLLSPRQAGKLLGIHEITLRRASQRGELRRFYVGRGIRYRQSDLEAWTRGEPMPAQSIATN